jgi:hypothetical protein
VDLVGKHGRVRTVKSSQNLFCLILIGFRAGRDQVSGALLNRLE